MLVLPVAKAKYSIIKILKPNLLLLTLIQCKNKGNPIRCCSDNESNINTTNFTNLGEPFVESCRVISGFPITISVVIEHNYPHKLLIRIIAAENEFAN